MARDLHNTTLKVQIFMWDGRPVRKFFSGILDKKDWSMGLVKVRGQEGLQPRIFLTKPCAGCVSWGDLVQLGHEGGSMMWSQTNSLSLLEVSKDTRAETWVTTLSCLPLRDLATEAE